MYKTIFKRLIKPKNISGEFHPFSMENFQPRIANKYVFNN